MIDTPLLKKIKVIQMQEIKTWKGLHVEYISRPGKDLRYNLIGLTNLYQPKKNSKTGDYFRVRDACFKSV